MIGMRTILWWGRMFTYGSWTSVAQRIYLSNLDWALMTYSAIVGMSYALATIASRERAPFAPRNSRRGSRRRG